MSHPSWVRGLKLVFPLLVVLLVLSHPSWVRGLKQQDYLDKGLYQKSHPSWVRGLKLYLIIRTYLMYRRTPRGCVD